MKDYAAYAQKLFDEMDCDKLKIEMSAQDFPRYEDEMLEFLGIRRTETPAGKAPDGVYVNAESRTVLTVKDYELLDPEGTKRVLTPRSGTAFFADCIPTILDFSQEGLVKICGQQIIPEWTQTGTVYRKVELKEITEEDLEQCFKLQVSDDQMQYIASNKDSWNTAKENESVARTFAIYCDRKMVGFTMLAFDEEYEDPDDRYWLWRLMIDEASQNKGYGKAALQLIIDYFRENGANNIRLSTKDTNTNALSMYRGAGFYETGEMNDEEIVLQLDL
ncbi:MAG: GNAT family N-acetyltransferase [Lachnospiraceae bacterium]|nr:GNAT family N-acetyltransferase [Lachnospiraceae bacterium]